MTEAQVFPTVYTLILRRDTKYEQPKWILRKLQEYFGSSLVDAIVVNHQTVKQDGQLLIDIKISCQSDTRSIARRTMLEYDQVVVKTKRHVHIPPPEPTHFGTAWHERDQKDWKNDPNYHYDNPFGNIWNQEKKQWEFETFIYPQIEHDEL